MSVRITFKHERRRCWAVSISCSFSHTKIYNSQKNEIKLNSVNMRNYLSKSKFHCSCWCYCRFYNLNAGGLGLVMPWGWGWNLTDHIPFVCMLCIVRGIRQLFFDLCLLPFSSPWKHRGPFSYSGHGITINHLLTEYCI